MTNVVFDFDKTISRYDTFNKYMYYIGTKKISFKLLKILYQFIRLLRKFRFISNLTQKHYALNIFLPNNPSDLDRYSRDFIETIEFNSNILKKYKTEALRSQVFICSASPIIYLKELFPEATIIGLEFVKERKYRIVKHPYGKEKFNILKSMGVSQIDRLYTDSIKDKYLAKISKTVFIINNDEITQVNNYQEFINHFNNQS